MCCSGCFEDDFLHELIGREGVSDGQCAHCGKVGLPQVSAERLTPYFDEVLEAYSAKRDGRPISEILAEDWLVFDPATRHQRLIEEILGPELSAVTYVPRESASAPSGDFWAKFRIELQEKNRFFPANAPDKDLFRSLIGHLATVELPEQFYRARLMFDENPIPVENMGAPPAEIVSDGRANPIGIRYLYLADDAATAIAEVKPSKGAVATVASFRAVQGRRLSLVNLTSPRKTISPFRVAALADVRSSMAFLEALGEELSVPTQPHRATRDYLASQYLCELVKVSGYDGVIYQSSLAGGKNYAFFDVDACVPDGKRWVYKVSDVEVSSQISQEL